MKPLCLKINPIKLIALGIGFFASHGQSILAQEKESDLRRSKGDIATSLEIFNLWEKQPAVLVEALNSSYHYLSASKDRTLSGLMAQTEVQALLSHAGMTHLGGPMLGRISSNGAAVWIRTFKPAQVSVEVDMDGHTKTFGPVASSTESDLSVVITVTGLKPGSENPYRVLIDGVPAKTAGLTVIRTVPENGTPVRIAFGSCWHRWGIGHPQMKVLKSRKPSALLMLGDVAVQDRMGELGLHRYDYLQRDLNPAWQDFSAAVPVYAGWDDHDYAANDVAGVTDRFIAEDRSGIRQIFAQSWVNPQYGYESEQSGVFLRTRIGPCDVIMTDNRYFRLKGKGKDHFLGKEQMLWLKEQLLNCKGPFIILSCGTMWSDYVSGGKDSWGLSDPEGREEIFKLIEEHRIPGVLLISGDRHGARGFTIPRKDGFSLYEFEGASFGGRSGPPAKPAEGKHQLFGISGEYAFSEFEFNTAKSDPEVTFRLLSETGTLIFEQTLTHSQLTPK